MKRIVSVCMTLIMVLGLAICVSNNTQAAQERPMIDGSYLTDDDQSIGYVNKPGSMIRPQGEDLLISYSKCVRLGPGEMYAGGTTIAAHTVETIGVAVMIERAKKEDTEWTFYDSWEKFNTNKDRVASTKYLKVEGDYYYRVRCLHAAGDDVSSSFTNGIYIEKP